MDKRAELGTFLRRRRETAPPLVAVRAGSRRRTPGLRREEVAELANISTVYYERLEQARGSLPSAPVLAGLAHALRLEDDARDHLYRLAGHAPPARPRTGEDVDPALDYVMDAVAGTTPASITDGLGDVLKQNRLNRELLGDVTGLPGWEANLTWRWFTSPAWRDLMEPRDQHEASGLAYAADLRAGLARREPDARAAALLADLLATSEEFVEAWDRHVVSALHCAAKVIEHPEVGRIDLECSVITSPTSSQRLLLLKPTPGTPSAGRIARLAAPYN
ncbi:helix-turn-helix transcriptional regulator [Kineosporia sp. NBRC 101731]|uniref:helix-turn-helix transcriptional regulator n=1 Tax=Kineosporia sp. NBRC 101731 TaxID=3032199 RepID=UPI0024A348B2|nr:helix-turn-helix transcriptional regulator [Kineosporia sp. NBRC 101731]GLY30490.1 transcriptional regulator [Kineosporia sp. NBRC 101731]